MTAGSKPTGYVFHNADYDVIQACQSDGTWVALGPINCPAGNGCPAGCPNIGDLCSDGSYYIGQISSMKIYAASADESGTLAWADNDANHQADSITDGLTNTNWLVDSSPDSHPAAQACRNKGAGWYLPANDELNLMWVMVNTYGVTAGLDTSGSWYWSSTESTSGTARPQRFSDGSQPSYGKDVNFLVRCVKR